jgi:hypothetical protein
VTPWYQLTRLIWWPRSPRTAALACGLLVGVPSGVLGYLGVFAMTLGTTPGGLTTGLCQAAFFGLIAGVVARRVRRRWVELEDRSDVERLIAIHAVHFGEDVGSDPLALTTLEFAAWQRARIENRAREYGLSWLGCAGGFAAGSALIQAQAGLWIRAAGCALLAVVLLLLGLDGSKRWKRLAEPLWNAEWYAAWRLQRTGT